MVLLPLFRQLKFRLVVLFFVALRTALLLITVSEIENNHGLFVAKARRASPRQFVGDCTAVVVCCPPANALVSENFFPCGVVVSQGRLEGSHAAPRQTCWSATSEAGVGHEISKDKTLSGRVMATGLITPRGRAACTAPTRKNGGESYAVFPTTTVQGQAKRSSFIIIEMDGTQVGTLLNGERYGPCAARPNDASVVR